MILVTGAAGKTGRAVVAALQHHAQPIRALLRSPEQTGQLSGVDGVVADLLNPAALSAIFDGVEAVYHICPNLHPQEVEIGRNALEAAQHSGVGRFVLHSALHPQVQAMPHHWNKLLVEESLINSGLPFTILQPTSYMQNLLPEWWRVRLRSLYHVPYSLAARFSPVDLEDVAEVAATVLTSDQHDGATYELAGPELHTPQSIANEMGEALGKIISAVQIPLDQWPVPDEMDPKRRAMLISMFEYYSEHGLWGNPRVLADLLGRPPTTLGDYLNLLVQEAPEP
jgi:uncharacterized protein YbjT (DUF2867 family)